MSRSIKEITLKEIILGIQDWARFLLSKWKVIVIAGLLGAAIGLTKAWLQKKVYTANMTFAVEEKSGGMGAFLGIASQIGFDLGKGENGLFSGDNLLELMKSRMLIEKTLLTPVTIDGKKTLLVNRYLDFQMKDEKDEEVKKKVKYFVDGESRDVYTLSQDSLLNTIYEDMKQNLLLEKVEKKLSIIDVKFKSKDEIFAKHFVEILVNNVSEFYIEIKTKKTKANITLLESRLDSVRKALDIDMFGAALSQDQNLNPARSQVRVPQVKKQMNVQILTTLYGELIKNLEISKLTLMREEPLIQVIDKPILPLEYKKAGRLTSLIIGGMLGAIAASLMYIIARIYTNVMKDTIVQ